LEEGTAGARRIQIVDELAIRLLLFRISLEFGFVPLWWQIRKRILLGGGLGGSRDEETRSIFMMPEIVPQIL
jgi:hypothetical protein